MATGSVSCIVTTPKLHRAIIGGGDNTIIFLHGWGQSLESLRPMAELLSDTYCIHLIDLPGFGQTPKPDEDWDTILYAEAIHKYIEEEKLAKVDILGHSFGGRVAIRLTKRYPEEIRGLILLNSGGLQRKLNGKKKLRAKFIKLINKLVKFTDKYFSTNLFHNWFIPKFASRDYKAAGALKNILVKTVNEDLSTEAAEIKKQTLLLWGELDDETPLEYGKRYNSLIQNSRLVVLPGKDHFPFLGMGAHQCAKYVREFLESLSLEDKLKNKEI